MTDQKRAKIPGWTYLVMAVTAAMLSIHLHARQSVMLPSYNPADDTGYFQAEDALQYRYARMLANGEAVPFIDTRAQYPEGLKVGREISLWMEQVTAFTSRVLYGSPPRPYHTFVIFLVCVLSGVSVLACYLLGLSLGEPPAALAAALLFGVCWIGSTLTTAAYGFQTFALPLLFFAVAALAAALSEGSARPGAWSPPAAAWAAAGGAALAIALVSWHFTRFFLVSLWLALAYAAWRSRGDEPALKRLRLCVCALLVSCAAAGLGTAVLRETAFVASPAFLLGCSLLACLTLRGRRLASLLLLFGLAALWQAGRESASYGHVYSLLWDKLRFALVKPADPLKLSQEARLLWTGPFDSPQLGYLVFSFLPLALAGAPRVWRFIKGPPVKEPAGALCDALLLIYAVGTVLVRRLAPVLAFFICLASLRRGGGRSNTIRLAAGLAALAFFESLKTAAPQSPLNLVMPLAAYLTPAGGQPEVSIVDERSMLEWLRRHGEARPVAAGFGVSAAVLAYTPSPVLLQPKFESAAIRGKSAEYLRALYSDEDAFLAFCRKYGAKLFVYCVVGVLDETADGSRYMAGTTVLNESMAAVRFHFFPEKLRHFRLLYEDNGFRIFAVGEPGAAHAARRPVYDLALFAPRRAEGGRLTIDAAGAVRRMGDSEHKLLLAGIYFRTGRPEKALALYEEAFSIWPPDERLKLNYDRLRSALKAPETRRAAR
ncbi:MAG: hypothetical protein Q7R35_09805 [Elusimicrobiota bacterium]|nr:hypothetical protein [Elusimicrobiota bacterium]